MVKKSNVNRNDEFGGLSNGTLVFPQDMEQEFYPESIKFGIYERQGPSYSKLKENVSALTGVIRVQDVDDNLQLADIITENQEALAIQNKLAPAKQNAELIAALKGNIKSAKAERGISFQEAKNIGKDIANDVTKLSKEKSVEHHIQSIYLNNS